MSINLPMDPTGVRKTEEMETSQERALEPPKHERKVRQLAARLAKEGLDLKEVTRIALEGLIESLGFERGFLVVGTQSGALDQQGETDGPPFRIISARACRRQADREAGTDFEDVPNPEFAINRSAVKRAFHSPQAIVINDSLMPPHADLQEVHRSVLCQPFSIAPSVAAVIYLDRGLGAEPVREPDLLALADFAERCQPTLGRAYLYEEVLALRERLESVESEEEAPPEEAPEAATPAAGRQPEAAEDEPSLTISAVEVPVYHGMVGKSEKMTRIFQVIEKMKDSDLNVCIFGESGTGKELVARAIHDTSPRREKRFVSENCGTIAESLLESELFGHMKGAFTGAEEDHQGLFEIAGGGTLLLD